MNIYGDSVEVLISWPKTPPASPQCYVVQTGDSVPYGYRERPLDVYPTPGTWISLKVQRWTTQNPDSFDWAYYVNTTSTPKGVLYNTGMRSAMIAYGEERQALLTDDSGQLSFKSLSYLPLRGTAWYYVPNVLQDNDYLQNNDPYYHWDFSQIDSTYHKIMVQHD